MEPIWKDYEIDLGNDYMVEYRIKTGNQIIYNGKSYKAGGGRNIININGICADYIYTELPPLYDWATSGDTVSKVFTVERKRGDGVWVVVESVQFYNDHSYDFDKDVLTGQWLSDPIDETIDVRMPILLTHVSEDGDANGLYIYTKEGTIIEAEDIDNNGTMCIKPEQYENIAYVRDMLLPAHGAFNFHIENTCSRYALYYVNAYGGFDQLIMRGAYKEKDGLTRHTYRKHYDNSYMVNRGIVNYVNEISKSITLNTGWLTDEQSLKMHHLLNSTDVYLYDMEYLTMVPVIIKATTTEYKTFKNTGGQMVDYSIEVTIAKNIVRK